jgi:hypothetical protein
MAELPPGLALIGLRGVSETELRGHSSPARLGASQFLIHLCIHLIGKREEGRGDYYSVAFSMYSREEQ